MEAIKKGIALNQKYIDAETYAKKLEGISRATFWYQSKAKFSKANQLQQENKKIQSQLEQGRKELVIRRNFRLLELYRKENEEFERELASRGLAILKIKH